jgi:hypothetical protein
MGLLSDFFVASAQDIPDLDLRTMEAQFPVVQGSGIDPIMLAELDFLVTGERQREPELVRDDGEAWVYRLDAALVRALANLSDEQIGQTADEWIGDIDGTATGFVGKLRALAQTAVDRGHELYVHIGL